MLSSSLKCICQEHGISVAPNFPGFLVPAPCRATASKANQQPQTVVVLGITEYLCCPVDLFPRCFKHLLLSNTDLRRFACYVLF